MTKIEEKIDEIKEVIRTINDSEEDDKIAIKSAKEEIKRKSQEYIELVKRKEKELLEQIENVERHKIGILEKKNEDVQKKVDKLQNSKAILRVIYLQTYQARVIRNKSILLEHAKIAEESSNKYQPKTSGNIAFQGETVQTPFPIGHITLKAKDSMDVIKPLGISVCGNGDILVAQQNNSLIIIEHKTREKVQLEKFGKKKIQLNLQTPCAMEVTADGKQVWLCNQNRLQSLEIKGKQLILVGDYIIRGPKGIAINENTGQIFVVDSTGKSITILPENIKRNLEQQVDSPRGAAFDRDSNLLIVNKSYVKKFTQQGQFLGQFGSKSGDCGSVDGQLKGASSITADENGLVYVTEEKTHCISAYSERGRFLCSFREDATQRVKFMCPNGIATDGQGHLYVCDIHRSKVISFNIL